MLNIPNVVIEVADTTSRTFYEPEYVVPLIRAMWTGIIDPLKDITTKAPTGKYQEAFAHTKFNGTLDEFIAYEERRLRNLYGINPRTNGLLFDIVYPGSMFGMTVRKLIGAEADAPTEEKTVLRTQPLVDIGVSQADAEVMVAAGFDSVDKLAAASVGDLLPLPRIGKVRAERYIAAAFAAIYGPGDAVPAAPDSLED